MVQNPRETASSSPIRSLNQPVPIQVEEDAYQRPLAISLRRRRLEVAAIDDLWEIDEEWWRENPIVRRYYQVTTEDGRPMTVFRDLASGEWYRQGG